MLIKENHGKITLEDARKVIIKWKKCFFKWFKKEWNDELEKLLNLELKFYKSDKSNGFYVLITPEEAELLIDKYIKFNLYNSPFVWTI